MNGSITTNRDQSFMVGFLLGLLVGGVIAGLTAPQGGQQTRTLVRERSLEWKDRAEDIALRAQQRTSEALGRFRRNV